MASKLSDLSHIPRRTVFLTTTALCLCTHLCAPLPLRAQVETSAAALPAPTKEEMAEAKQHFQGGVKAFQESDFQTAAAEFQEAYRLSRRPDLLFNLARVAENMGKPAQAVDYLEAYLRERPDAPDRAQVGADVERLKRQIRADREAAQRAAAVAVAAPVPVAVPAAGDKRTLWQRLPPWPALALMGGGTVVLVTGLGLGGAALSAANQVQSGMTFDKSADARGRSLNAAAISLDVIGGVALGAGVAWTIYWAVHRKPPAETTPQIQPSISAGHGAASLGVALSF